MRRMGLVMLAAALPGVAAAEDAWIRIEAKRGAAAEAAVAGWRAKHGDVQVFRLPGGFTGIALGPMDAAAAAARMAQLKAAGEIPADSYLTEPGGAAPLALRALGETPTAVAAGPGADAPAAGAAAANATDETRATHIQLQATPGRNSADQTLRRWRATFPEAGLWRMANGMYVVALSAETAGGAADRMRALKAEGRIPGDAYLTETADLGTVIEAGTAAAQVPMTAPAGAPGAPVVVPGAPDTPGLPDAGGGPAVAGTAVASDVAGGADPSADQQAALPTSGTPDPSADPALPATGTAGLPDAPGAPPVAPGVASTAGLAGTGAAVPANGTDGGTAALTQVAPVEAAPVEAAQTEAAPAVMPPIDEVQRALHWAGEYDGPIDGQSGPGTRAAIDAEIAAHAVGQTPAEAMVALLARREAWRGEMGLTRLDDPGSGLGAMVPMARLAFDRVERGLSIYGPRDGSGAALILTRQPGGQQEMLDFAGLVTALGWVPAPQRQVASGWVTLEGADADHHGHAEARVVDGQMEGWVLIWPQADAANAKRLAVEIGETLSVTPVVEPEVAPAPGVMPGGGTEPSQ